jgi:signal transduction histidine kinase
MRTELEMALLRPRPPEDTKVALESLQDQVERLIGLSNALLDLEEVRAGEALAGEQIDLTELVTDVVERYQPKATANGRRIETAARAGAHEASSGVVLVEANRHWLDVALRNLVSNALRHGRGTITISTTQDNGRVQLSVGDEGAGFPPEFVGQAFDRFARAESSRSSRGTGLGLSLVQAVAEAHGGTATIIGSSVRLDLPVGHTDS